MATYPQAFLLGGSDLVPDPLPGDLALELGKGQKNIEGQSAHGIDGVEGLGHGYEGDTATIEHLDDPGEENRVRRLTL